MTEQTVLTDEVEAAFQAFYRKELPDADFTAAIWNVERFLFKAGWDSAVLAKQAQAPTGQSGEGEGLLKEAEELLSRFAYSNRPYGSPNYSASMADLIKRLAAALRAQGAGEPPVAQAHIGADGRTDMERRLMGQLSDALKQLDDILVAHPVSQPPSGQEKQSG